MDAKPWEWPEAHWRQITHIVRAGRSLAPAHWPDGARCAVALSFEAGHDTIALRDGDAGLARISQGQYGARQGSLRIRAMLERQMLPASFFYPAVCALLYPDEVRALAAEGHEIGIHSWIHEANTSLPPGVERELTLRAAEVLEKISGQRPVGIRTASRDFSEDSMGIIQELGLLYDSSLMADDDPYELQAQGRPSGIVELPPGWLRDDAAHFDMNHPCAPPPPTPPSALEEIFWAEFEGARAEGGVLLLSLHPHLIGHRSRIAMLERLLARMRATGECWFCTLAELARWCARHARTGALHAGDRPR